MSTTKSCIPPTAAETYARLYPVFRRLYEATRQPVHTLARLQAGADS